jgi:type II secretory pathway pseudopilin PulG
MPIAYSCPHCGKQFTVADQYAGQSGPCAACGKPITIPMAGAGPVGMPPPGYNYRPQAAATGAGASLAVVIIALAVVPLLIIGILVALLLPAVSAARGAAKRMSSQNNMKQLALALHNYHDAHQTFPPAVVTDAAGKPLYSGRVLLLPYLEQAPIYDQWDKSQAWDSPRNKPLADAMIPTFRDPAETGPMNQTSYLFSAGPGSLFEPGQNVKFSNVPDGLSNTIMMVEVKGSGIGWAEPRDIDLSQPTGLPQGNHAMGNNVAMGDGSVKTLPSNTPPTTIQAAATRAGGEMVLLP